MLTFASKPTSRRPIAKTTAGPAYNGRNGHVGKKVPAIVGETVRASGQPIETATRTWMESRFGQDFSQVRIHADEAAAKSAEAIDASAYTAGNHVVFGAARYSPSTGPGRRLLAHELAHVVQQGQAGSGPATVQRQPLKNEEATPSRDRREGEEVTSTEEQQHRFLEAFNKNPSAALADIANVLEIGGGQFEVYGLVYVDDETGKLEIVRMLAPQQRAIIGELRRLLSREVKNVDQDVGQTKSLLQQLADMTGVQAALDRISIRPGRALDVLARVQAELDAGSPGYRSVPDGDLSDVESAIESFSHGAALPIARQDRPRPSGKTLLGYFHTHPQTLPPSGKQGDIGATAAEGVGSFVITGTPDKPLIYFIADGQYWDLTNGLREGLDRQASFVAGFDRALGGAFAELAIGAHGFGVRARLSEQRPGLRVSEGFNIGDYRMTLAGELNPAVPTGDASLVGRPRTRELLEASSLGSELEFSFRQQSWLPGTLTLQALSAGAMRIEGRAIDPLSLSFDLVGGTTIFRGTAGLESEKFFGLETPAAVPLPVLPGGVGYGLRYVGGRNLQLNVFYENPWMKVDYSQPLTGEGESGFSTSFNYRLPAGTLRLQLGYEGQIFGSIGYQLPL